MANKLRHAGQVCVCANRIFVQKNVYEKFAQVVRGGMEKLKFGHGLDEGKPRFFVSVVCNRQGLTV